MTVRCRYLFNEQSPETVSYKDQGKLGASSLFPTQSVHHRRPKHGHVTHAVKTPDTPQPTAKLPCDIADTLEGSTVEKLGIVTVHYNASAFKVVGKRVAEPHVALCLLLEGPEGVTSKS